jgi:TolA-binding protein
VIKKPKIIIPLIVIAFFFGCSAYFNTFYNAEEAFNSARRPHSKAMKKFPDSLVVTPSPQVEALYDRTIEKSLKMMEVYPKNKKHQPKAHYLMGRSSFYKKDFDVSISRMRDLQTEFPESRLVPPSLIYVAKSHIMLDNLAIAEEILLEILENYPEFDKHQEITLLLVEIAIRREGRSQALFLLQALNLSGMPIEKRLDIILKMADLHYELRQYTTALGLLRGAPRSKKHPYLMYRVDRSFYFCYDAMDSLDVALNHLNKMQRNRLYNREHKDEILFYKAVTLRKMGRIDEAIALLIEITQKCDRATADASSLCGRAYYELALLYQLGTGEYALALEAFEKASRSGDPDAMARANARVIALRRLFELRMGDEEGVVSPQARYSIAELFWLDLQEPDSAYYHYMKLSHENGADSLLRPRSLIMAASVLRNEMGETARSDSLLNLVISEYPNSELAKRAQVEMDVEITVVTRRDLAERDFLAAEGLMESNMIEAVKAFYNVFKQYPDMDIAPKSLHAAAWNTDNALQRNRAAMRLYEELCTRYPESRYCIESAAPRLAAARDTLEARRLMREKAKEEKAEAVSAPDGSSAADAEDESDEDYIDGINTDSDGNADPDIGITADTDVDTDKSGSDDSDTDKTNDDNPDTDKQE